MTASTLFALWILYQASGVTPAGDTPRAVEVFHSERACETRAIMLNDAELPKRKRDQWKGWWTTSWCRPLGARARESLTSLRFGGHIAEAIQMGAGTMLCEKKLPNGGRLYRNEYCPEPYRVR